MRVLVLSLLRVSSTDNGCSLGAVGGIPLQSWGFKERHIQLWRTYGFLGGKPEVPQQSLCHLGLWRKMGLLIVRTLLGLKSEYSPWPVDPVGPVPLYLSHQNSWISLHHAATVTSASSLFLHTRHWDPLPSFSTGHYLHLGYIFPDRNLLQAFAQMSQS